MNLASMPTIVIPAKCGEGTLAGLIETLGVPIVGQILGAGYIIGVLEMVVAVVALLFLAFSHKRGKAIAAIAVLLFCLLILGSVTTLVKIFVPGGC